MAGKARTGKSKGTFRDFGLLDWARWTFFSIFGMLSVASLVYGLSPSREGLDAEAKAQQVIEELCGKLEKEDPEAARVIREKSKAGQAKGLAVALLVKQSERENAGLKEIAEALTRPGTPALVEFFNECLDKDVIQGDSARRQYIDSQGALLAMANPREIVEDPVLGRRLVEEHVARIRRAMAEPAYWAEVKDDPLAILVLDEVPDQGTRRTYLKERGWLGEVIAFFRLADPNKPLEGNGGLLGDNPGRVPDGRGWSELIEAAAKYAPMPEELVTKEKLGAAGYGIFLSHGDLIRDLVGRNIPLREVAEVVFASSGSIPEDGDEAARYLERLYKDKRPVWDAAKSYSYVLELDRALPDKSIALLDNLATSDVAAFLMTKCEEFLAPAAESILKYREMALFIIAQYHQNKLFVQAMNAPGGFRVPAFLIAQNPMNGANNLVAAANPKAVNALFLPNGNPVQANFWQALPLVGGPLKLVNNWRNDRASDWSDVGWALMDVGDTALIVLTLGAATPKAGATAAAKAAAKAAARELAEKASKTTLQTVVKEGGEAALKESSKRLSLLARLAGIGEKVIQAAAPVYRVGRAVVGTGKWIVSNTLFVVNKTWEAGKTIWAALPRGLQQAIRVTILVLTIGYGMVERTLPMLEKKFAELPGFLRDTLGRAVSAFVDFARKAVDMILAPPGLTMRLVVGGATCALSGGLAYVLFPFRRRRPAF